MAGQQARLQRIGDLGTVPQHPAGPHRQRELLAELLDQPDVGQPEMTVPGGPGQGQRAVAVVAVHERHAEQ